MSFTITNVKLVSEDATDSKEGPGYQRMYHVYYTGGYSAYGLRNNSETALPKVGNFHPEDELCKVSGININNHPDDGAVGEGIAEYKVTYSAPTLSMFDANPLDRPAEITWGGSDLTEVCQKDASGTLIKNSAGELYVDRPARPIKGAECTIKRNESSNPASACTTISNTTNSSTWHGVSAGNALMGKITGIKKTEMVNGIQVEYWEVTYPIKFRRDSWYLKLIDCGASEKISSKLVPITDDLGNMMGIQLLDGSGQKLSVGGTPVVYPAAGYKINDEVDWSSLSLPDPYA